MIKLEEIGYEDLKPLVQLGFGEDPELMDKYQQLHTEFDVTIDRNLTNIKDAQAIFNFTYYKVKWDKETIGFSVIEKEQMLLYSFAIGIKFRTKEIVVAWFNKIKEVFDGLFGVILWNQNIRAISFLVRQGMKVVDVNKETTSLILL